MLRAKQSNNLKSVHFKIFDRETEIGFVDWSAWPMAKNARLRGLIPEKITIPRIVLRHEEFTIEFQYTKRDWSNDTNYYLKKGSEVLSVIEVRQQKGWFKRPLIKITSPFDGSLQRKGSLLRQSYSVLDKESEIGTIGEKSGFTIGRELELKFKNPPSEAVQCFLLFMVVNSAFG